MSRIAVILSGCGVYDGAEIHESTATLLALAEAGAKVTVAAPDIAQMHVVDHQAGEPAGGESRNVRIEAARIARGPVEDVADLRSEDFDAVILPGGFGAAKNLSSFAVDGPACTVNPEVTDFLKAMHADGKAIGAICIAPVIIARVFGEEKPVKLTIGNDAGTAAAIESMGAVHVEAPADGIVVDDDARVVSTPAYMSAGGITEVFDGISKLVAKVLELADQRD